MESKHSVVCVCVDKGPDKLLDYAVPFSMQVQEGMRVVVPLRKRMCTGVVVEVKSVSACARLQEIAEVVAGTPLSSALLRLALWMSSYYAAPLSSVFSLFFPTFANKEGKKQLTLTAQVSKRELADLCRELIGSPQGRVLECMLAAPKGALLSEVMKKAEVSRSPVEALIKKGVLSSALLAVDRVRIQEMDYFLCAPKVLNEAQLEALKKIQGDMGQHATHLLFGVTGSGKTEVYMQAIEHAHASGRGAILLVPEIALTAQTVERLRSRFPEGVAILHSRLSAAERRESWDLIARGEVRLVVGARSALFCPMRDVGLIIVDEEPEHSYKQEERAPSYHARDVAIMRGRYEGVVVVLGSATPSIETYHRALEGRYKLSVLGGRAATDSTLPKVTLVDMKTEQNKGAHLFSDVLIDGIRKRCSSGEQSLIFLNRRGFHTYPQCGGCGKGVECPHCTRVLTHHPKENKLLCHLCHFVYSPPPKMCGFCGAEGLIQYKGYGTQKVESLLHVRVPGVRTLRIDADTTQHVGSHERLFKEFRSGKADVLIGTQMVAKGLHFPAVTLVGVLHADASLNVPDFRAAELTFQLLTQVAGRAGRADFPGEVIVQTSLASHELMGHIERLDYVGFYKEEIELRRLFSYPPFSHFTRCIFSGPSQDAVYAAACSLREHLIAKMPPSYKLHPPTACGYAKLRGLFRFHFLIQGPPSGRFLRDLPKPYGATLTIDIDPLSTYV